jgi:hypothetical protein
MKMTDRILDLIVRFRRRKAPRADTQRQRARQTTPRRTWSEAMNMTNRIFDYIVQYKRDNDGNSPSLRELVADCEAGGTSAARYHVLKLERQGRVTLPAVGRPRSIQVTGGRWTYEPPGEGTEGAHGRGAEADPQRDEAEVVLQ